MRRRTPFPPTLAPSREKRRGRARAMRSAAKVSSSLSGNARACPTPCARSGRSASGLSPNLPKSALAKRVSLDEKKKLRRSSRKPPPAGSRRRVRSWRNTSESMGPCALASSPRPWSAFPGASAAACCSCHPSCGTNFPRPLIISPVAFAKDQTGIFWVNDLSLHAGDPAQRAAEIAQRSGSRVHLCPRSLSRASLAILHPEPASPQIAAALSPRDLLRGLDPVVRKNGRGREGDRFSRGSPHSIARRPLARLPHRDRLRLCTTERSPWPRRAAVVARRAWASPRAEARGDVNWYTSSPTIPMSYLLGRLEVEHACTRISSAGPVGRCANSMTGCSASARFRGRGFGNLLCGVEPEAIQPVDRSIEHLSSKKSCLRGLTFASISASHARLLVPPPRERRAIPAAPRPGRRTHQIAARSRALADRRHPRRIRRRPRADRRAFARRAARSPQALRPERLGWRARSAGSRCLSRLGRTPLAVRRALRLESDGGPSRAFRQGNRGAALDQA